MKRSIARVIAGVGLAGAVMALALVPPGATSTPQARTFDVPPPAPVVGCPGQLEVPVGDVGSGSDLGSQATERLFDVISPGQTESAGDGFASQAAAASQVERVGDGDIEGWAALTCGQPRADQWLLGGSTSLGASARLVLTNPAAAPTEATITLYGPLGEVESTVVAVAPGDQQDRLLEGVASGVAALAVRVEATGPGVVASLQDSRLAGFQPAGVAWVGPTEASDALIIPAVHLDQPDATVTLRLFSPDEALVELTLVTDEGISDFSMTRPIDLEPGVVSDVTIPAERAGAIEIRADVPVYAAALTTVPRAVEEGLEGDLAYDHTWVAAQAEPTGPTAIVMPTGAGRLALYSPVSQQATVADADGNPLATVDLAPRTLAWVDIDAQAGTVLVVDDRVAWALVLEADDGRVATLEPVGIGTVPRSQAVVPARYPE